MTQAYVVAGLAFGDEGKGKMVDFLTRYYNADLVVRYNGGPQAAHNVVTPEGVHHTFAQFGSGTLAGARTHLSRFMLVDPISLECEGSVLKEKVIGNPYAGLTVDPNCTIITPWHKLMNRLRETVRGPLDSLLTERHGSVGLGVGEARMDQLDGFQLTAKDLRSVTTTAAILRTHQQMKLDQGVILTGGWPLHEPKDLATYDLHEQMLKTDPVLIAGRYKAIFDQITLTDKLPVRNSPVVFEGAQGVLLDEECGYRPPHVSWTNCTFANANTLLEESGLAWDVERIGVLRTYFTRHGPGPFPTEDVAMNYPEPHNGTHPWMGKFRQGRFDSNLAQYAIGEVGKIDCIALTHLDVCPVDWDFISSVLIKYRSYGPTYLENDVYFPVGVFI